MIDNFTIAKEVISGKWGNGETRKKKLTEAGYDYNQIQHIVNELLKLGFTFTPDPEYKELLIIDYDPEKYQGIQVNVLI